MLQLEATFRALKTHRNNFCQRSFTPALFKHSPSDGGHPQSPLSLQQHHMVQRSYLNNFSRCVALNTSCVWHHAHQASHVCLLPVCSATSPSSPSALARNSAYGTFQHRPIYIDSPYPPVRWPMIWRLSPVQDRRQYQSVMIRDTRIDPKLHPNKPQTQPLTKPAGSALADVVQAQPHDVRDPLDPWNNGWDSCMPQTGGVDNLLLRTY